MQIFRDFPLTPRFGSALAIGNFDGVHLGHLALLEHVKKEAKKRNLLASVLTFFPHPRQYFAIKTNRLNEAPTTLTTLRTKLKSIAKAGIDQTILLRFNEKIASLSKDDFIQDVLVDGLNTKYLVVGESFRFGKNRSGSTEDLKKAGEQFGFTVFVLSQVKDNDSRISSSRVRDALKKNDFISAKKLLGYPYHISGRIIHGDKRGRQLGFPTANLPLNHFNPILSGVYITEILGLEKEALPAVSMIGTRPTIDKNPKIVLETHILDYNQTCYGKRIEVHFLEKLRDNQKFESLNALKDAISNDVTSTRHFFLKREKDC